MTDHTEKEFARSTRFDRLSRRSATFLLLSGTLLLTAASSNSVLGRGLARSRPILSKEKVSINAADGILYIAALQNKLLTGLQVESPKHQINFKPNGEISFTTSPAPKSRGYINNRSELASRSKIRGDRHSGWTSTDISYEVNFSDTAPDNWVICGQMHADDTPPDGRRRQPWLALHLGGRNAKGVFVPNLIWLGYKYISRQGDKGPNGAVMLGNAVANTWYRVRFRVRPGDASGKQPGRLQVWFEGNLVIDEAKDIGYLDEDSLTEYFRFGIYRGASSKTLNVRYRRIRQVFDA